MSIFNLLAVGFSCPLGNCFHQLNCCFEVGRCVKLSLYSLNSGFIHIHDILDPALDIITSFCQVEVPQISHPLIGTWCSLSAISIDIWRVFLTHINHFLVTINEDFKIHLVDTSFYLLNSEQLRWKECRVIYLQTICGLLIACLKRHNTRGSISIILLIAPRWINN